MTTETLPQLDPESFRTFIQGLHADLAARNLVVQSIHAQGFVHVLEQHFQLTERQHGLLAAGRSKGPETGVWNQVLASTLAAGGNVRLVHEGGDSTDIELHLHLGVVDIDASIHC